MFQWSVVTMSRDSCVRGQSPYVFTAMSRVSLKLSVPDFHCKRTNIKEGKLFFFFLLEILFRILDLSTIILSLLYVFSFLDFYLPSLSCFSLSFASSLHLLNLYLKGDWYSWMCIAFSIWNLEIVHTYFLTCHVSFLMKNCISKFPYFPLSLPFAPINIEFQRKNPFKFQKLKM